MNISEAGRKRTSELVDQLAHDSGFIGPDRHLRGQALRPSGAEIHAARNEDGTKRDVGEHVAIDLALDATSASTEKIAGAVSMTSRIATVAKYAGGAIELGSIGWFAAEAGGELIRAEEKSVEIQNAYDNDALVGALAGNLAFDPAFAAVVQAARPVNPNRRAILTVALQDPKNPTRAVLQARADEGYLAAERALKETANVPPGQRAQALHTWFTNHYGDRILKDVAFAMGIQYHAFVSDAGKRGLYGIDPSAETKKIEARAPIERPLMVQP